MRIGNLFERDGNVLEVVRISKDGTINYEVVEKSKGQHVNSGVVRPIKITEDWLIRLGFEKKSWFLEGVDFEHIYYQLGDIVVYLLKNSFEIELIKQGVQFNLFINFKKEVHILQNLIHALTNTELECTSK